MENIAGRIKSSPSTARILPPVKMRKNNKTKLEIEFFESFCLFFFRLKPLSLSLSSTSLTDTHATHAIPSSIFTERKQTKLVSVFLLFSFIIQEAECYLYINGNSPLLSLQLPTKIRLFIIT